MEESHPETPVKVKPPSFSFTPLSKVDSVDSENCEKDSNEDNEKTGGSGGGAAFVFGKNLASRVENSASAGTVFGENMANRNLASPKSNAGKVVFGENLSDRVANGSEEQQEDRGASSPTNDASSSPKNSNSTTATTVTSPSKENLLFSSVATPGKEIVPKNQDEESSKKSLSEAAAEYTESHSNKRKYEEVTVVTGEEEESNVLKINVKLYLFNSEAKTWTERGRGMLRLNDAPVSTPGHLKSRLVMRTSGSLRVVLNTKLWPEMVCQRPNEKSVRISAMDGDIARVFLISASHKDTDKLFKALENRLSQLKTDKAESEEPPEKRAGLEN